MYIVSGILVDNLNPVCFSNSMLQFAATSRLPTFAQLCFCIFYKPLSCFIHRCLLLLQLVLSLSFICLFLANGTHHPPLWDNGSATYTAIIRDAHLRLYSNLHIQPNQLDQGVVHHLACAFIFC